MSHNKRDAFQEYLGNNTQEGFPFKLFAAIDGNRWDDLQSMLAPDVVYERPGYPPIKGISEIMNFYRAVRNVVDGTHDLDVITERNDRIFCHGRFTGRNKSYQLIEVDFCDFYSLSSGLLSFRKTFFHVAVI